MISSKSCDRCFKSHQKCDRNKPSCNRCSSKGKVCSYSLIFKPVTKVEGNQTLKSTRIKAKDLKIVMDSKISKSKIKVSSYNHPLHNFVTKSSLIYLENMLTIVELPTSFRNGPNLDTFIKLMQSLLGHFKTRKDVSLLTLTKTDVLPIEILKLSYKAFWKYNNTMVPLFIEKGFNFDNKPKILRLVIVACGLQWMPKDARVEALINQLNELIFNLVNPLYHLKPTLNNIQVIILILTGLVSNSKFMRLFSRFLYHASSCADIIGLQFQRPYLNLSQNRERALAYVNLKFICMNRFVYAGGYETCPIETRALACSYNDLLESLNSSTKLEFIPKNHAIFIGFFYNQLSNILFHLALLKKRILFNHTIKSEQLTKICYLLLSKVDALEYTYCSNYIKLFPDLSSDIPNMISFISHCLRFFINSFALYLGSPILTSQSSILQTVIKSCEQVINVIVKLPHHCLLIFGLTNTVQCMMFLLRHKKFSTSCSINELFDKLYKYLDGLEDRWNFAPMIRVNKALIERLVRDCINV